MYKISHTIIKTVPKLDKTLKNSIKSNVKFIYTKNKSINSNFSVYNVSKKNFFFSNKDDFTEEVLKNKKSDMKENWYETSETLVFQNGKYFVLKVHPREIKIVQVFEYLMLTPALLFTGYKFVRNLISLRPVRTVLWGAAFLVFLRIYQGAYVNKNYFIYELHLLEDGKRVEITKAKGKIVADINTIRRLTPEEALYFAQIMPDAHVNYIPIIVENQFFLIFKNSIINDKEIFAAITSSQNIKVKEENIINKEDAIDIDSK
jgi:hypothetical protein